MDRHELRQLYQEDDARRVLRLTQSVESDNRASIAQAEEAGAGRHL